MNTNTVIHGDCTRIMPRIPARSIDFVLADPPYIARYHSRDGQTLAGDDNSDWLEPAFAQVYRVLRRDAVCISFYGWPRTDLFFRAWKKAGFRIGGHIVFRKRYASKSAFLQYRHESAYLLLKGNPAYPEAPLPDVMDWRYTGNTYHPTQKSVHILMPLIEAFTRKDQTVLDPFAGSGSTLVAAQRLERRYLGIELDARHHKTACKRLASR